MSNPPENAATDRSTDRVAQSAIAHGTPSIWKGWNLFFRHRYALRQRLATVSRVLIREGIPYALIGWNAVGYYVARVDPAAVRTTADLNLLMNEEDVPPRRRGADVP